MNVKQIAFVVAPLALFAALSGGPVWAHHGGAQWSDDVVTFKPTTVTVTDFQFINPHVQLYFDVTDGNGTVSHWGGQFIWDPAMLSRYGWSRHTIKVGDHITVVGRPAKSGASVMSVTKVILADGTEMETKPPDKSPTPSQP